MSKSAGYLLLILASLILSACTVSPLWDSPDWAVLECRNLKGTFQHREHPEPEKSYSITDYCLFPDGTGCFISEFHEGTCTPPGWDHPIEVGKLSVPLSPLPPFSLSPPEPVRDPSIPVIPVPNSLEELVASAPLIVVGEVGPVIDWYDFAFATPVPQPVSFPQGTPRLSPNLGPVTDFSFTVEQVIRDDGTVTSGNPVVIRIGGHIDPDELRATSEEVDAIGVFPGARGLFLLTPYADGNGYGLVTWLHHILRTDTPLLTFMDGSPISFPGERVRMTLEEFTDYVQQQ